MEEPTVAFDLVPLICLKLLRVVLHIKMYFSKCETGWRNTSNCVFGLNYFTSKNFLGVGKAYINPSRVFVRFEKCLRVEDPVDSEEVCSLDIFYNVRQPLSVYFVQQALHMSI